jgi:hypothetical protein
MGQYGVRATIPMSVKSPWNAARRHNPDASPQQKSRHADQIVVSRIL